MKEFDYVVQDQLGIHARPAGKIARFAKEHADGAAIKIEKVGGKTVDALRVMALMGLGAKPGNTLHITVEGTDEDAVAAGLQELLATEKL